VEKIVINTTENVEKVEKIDRKEGEKVKYIFLKMLIRFSKILFWPLRKKIKFQELQRKLKKIKKFIMN